MTRVVFLGTPQFAVPVLEALARHHEVVLVVTQPDRPAGRGRAQYYIPAVKAAAEKLGLPIIQPEHLRYDEAALQALRQAQAEVFVLAAYGQLLRPKVLSIPPRGVIGVHASLLPKFRGAAPIAAAILQGEPETGISLMVTDRGMDTGDVLARRALPIAPDDTTESLTAKLAEMGAELLIETLPGWLAGEITPQPQDETQATFAPQFGKADGAIDWHRKAVAIDRQVRALTPWPGAFSHLSGKMLKVLRARPLPDWWGGEAAGTVVMVREGVGVATGEGLLLLEEVQLEGRKALDGRQFARGQREFVGSALL